MADKGVTAKVDLESVHVISLLYKYLNQVVTGEFNSFLMCIAKSTLWQSQLRGLPIIMAIPVEEFSREGYKIRKFFG